MKKLPDKYAKRLHDNSNVVGAIANVGKYMSSVKVAVATISLHIATTTLAFATLSLPLSNVSVPKANVRLAISDLTIPLANLMEYVSAMLNDNGKVSGDLSVSPAEIAILSPEMSTAFYASDIPP